MTRLGVECSTWLLKEAHAWTRAGPAAICSTGTGDNSGMQPDTGLSEAMDSGEILRRLETLSDEFPRAALEAVVERREEMTPELLRILQDTVDRAEELALQDDYMAHLYAMYLVAQFRETRAYPLVTRIALLPEDLLESLCGDFLTSGLSQVLASVCGGDLEGIQSVIENEDANEWSRGAALSALVTLVAAGEKSREEILAYFGELFRGGLVRRPSHAWSSLVSCCLDLYPEELIQEINRAYAEGLVDRAFVSPEHVEEEVAKGLAASRARLAKTPWYRLFEDTIKEMEGWACFQRKPKERPPSSLGPDVAVSPNRFTDTEWLAPPVAPIRNAARKVGRNERCPCGSGKKYKKCCGA